MDKKDNQVRNQSTSSLYSKSKYSFPRREKLKSRKKIKELFSKGSTFFLYPFKSFYITTESSSVPPQFLVSIPKRYFKKAVDRNLIKRQLREGYRLHKKYLWEDENTTFICLGIVYVGKEKYPSDYMQRKLKKLLKALPNASSKEKKASSTNEG